MSNPYNRTVHIRWADGEHPFRLGLKEIFELETICARGLGGIARQISHQDWSLRYVRETVRLGLIGGGMPALRALQMVETYIDEGSILAAIPVAIRVLDVTLDPPASVKKKPIKAESAARPMTSSTPATSTAPAS